MISLKELNPHGYDLTPEMAANIGVLLDKMNVVRSAYGKKMTVTSGLRSNADQMAINPSAPKSKHTTGEACDILDLDGALKKWIMANIPLMEKTGLWFEDFAFTKNWCHFQIVPPRSGHRFFTP